MDPHKLRLREVAGQVAGKVFFGTLLAAMRDSTIKGEYGHGGRGEEAFSAQFHEILAERMGQADAHGLTDALVKRFEKQTRLMADQGLVGKVGQ